MAEVEDWAKENEWKILDFNLRVENLSKFLALLVNYRDKLNPEGLVFNDGRLTCTIEDVKDTNMGLGVLPSGGMLIYFTGYIVFEGKATENNEIIVFSIRHNSEKYLIVSAVAMDIVRNYFILLLKNIEANFNETAIEIDTYINRTIQVLRTEPGFREQLSVDKMKETNVSTITEKKKRRTRDDAAKRVACALFFVEIKEIPNRTAAANRFRTSTQTIHKLQDDEEVIGFLEKMRKNREYANRIKNEVLSQKSGRT